MFQEASQQDAHAGRDTFLAELASKTLAILDDKMFHRYNDDLGCDEAHALFLYGISRYFRHTVFLSRVSPVAKVTNYQLPRERASIHPLPYYENLVEFFLHPFRRIRSALRTIGPQLSNWDALWLGWPHPLALCLLIYTRLCGGGPACFLMVRQNLPEQVRARYTGWRRFFGIRMARCLDIPLRLWARDVLIFTVGEEMFRHYSRSFRYVTAIESALVSERFLPDRKSALAQTSAVPKRLLYIGRLDREKGLPVLLRAVAGLRDQGRTVHVSLVGDGTEESALRELANELGIVTQVAFHGYVPFGEALFAFYRTTDLFVLPSLSEGLPQVLLHAMMFGVPVIASRVGGIPSVITHGQNGWLVEPGSVDQWVEGVATLQNNPTLLGQFREKGMEFAGTHTMEFHQQKMIESLAAFLEARKQRR